MPEPAQIKKKPLWKNDSDESLDKKTLENSSVVYALSDENTIGYGGSDTLTPSLNTPLPLVTSCYNVENHLSNTKKIKRKIKFNKNNEIKLNDNDITDNKIENKILKLGEGYVQALIECSFNLPRVSAQLERLMGTNVVRLTDPKYWIELRRRIHEDFNDQLEKRIENRKQNENEREMNLILKGYYSPENCPPRLINVHSIALEKEMENQRKLLLSGKTIQCPKELANHPVFRVNQKTNKIIAQRRSKLKTTRERNADRLLRQGAKWERERLIYEKMDQQKDIELQEKRDQIKKLENDYSNANRIRGTDLLRIKNRDYTECEIKLKNFLDNERDLMMNRLKAKTKHSQEHTRNLKILEKFSNTKEHTLVEDIKEDVDVADDDYENTKELNVSVSNTDINENKIQSINSSSEQIVDSGKVTDDDLISSIVEGSVSDSKFQKLYYEDPMIEQLMQTSNVRDMYALADDIIGNVPSVVKHKKKK